MGNLSMLSKSAHIKSIFPSVGQCYFPKYQLRLLTALAVYFPAAQGTEIRKGQGQSKGIASLGTGAVILLSRKTFHRYQNRGTSHQRRHLSLLHRPQILSNKVCTPTKKKRRKRQKKKSIQCWAIHSG